MCITRQERCEMRDDGCVPAAAVDERRARVADLIGDRPLSARSVLATALLGADQPHLTVGELVGWPRCSASATAPPAPACGAWSPTANSPATTAPTRSRAPCSNDASASTRQLGSTTPRSTVGRHVGAGGRLAGTPLGCRSARAAQSRHRAAPRRATGGRLDSPGQSRPGPLADAARRAGPAVRSLPQRRYGHPCRQREIPFQS